MKFLEDIWASIIGNTKTKIHDPIAGTFIVSWIVCNWNHIGLLFFGEGNATIRIRGFNEYIASTSLFEFNSIFVIPLILTIVYLFVFPWVSLIVKTLLTLVNQKLHEQAVDFELNKVTGHENLNKARLKANPDKQFLEQSVQLEIDRKKEIMEQSKQRTIRFEAKATEMKAIADEADSRRKIAELDKTKKEQQTDLERQKFTASSAEARATLASNRFPSSFLFMSLLSESLKKDGVTVPISISAEIVAAIFGYDNFQALLDDEHFNNESLSNVEYIYFDDSALAKKLEGIIIEGNSEDEDLTADLVFEHIQNIFENLPYRFVNLDELAQLSSEMCENDSYYLLENDGTSSAMAESDTIYEEVYIDGIDSSKFDNGFEAIVTATANGHHRKESDIPGRAMSITATVSSRVLLGKYALGQLEIESVGADLTKYWDDEPDS